MNENDRNRPLYMIGVAAALAGMHPQTLRSYEQKGLVNPGRSRGNTRLYSQADIERLNLISKLTDFFDAVISCIVASYDILDTADRDLCALLLGSFLFFLLSL